jgi:xanthine dehydrogenase accessory factor
VKQALPLLRFLMDHAVRGEGVVLVTLTDVTGSAARAPGEHMAVAADGAAIGSFSGGCVEAAVIAEALDVLATGRGRLVRFGAGSRYIDIRLPCGGGIDLLFTPNPPIDQLTRAIALLEARRPVTLSLSRAGALVAARAARIDAAGWTGEDFRVRHDPDLRLVILGHGAEPMALHEIATAYGAETVILSPQTSLVDEAHARGIAAHQLRTLGPSDHLTVDRWSAVVTLFHDHDWETALLVQALGGNPFFIGAMGSSRTHVERVRRLREAGADADAVDRIVGPVGLLHASRDPRTLALSIMAQVVQAYESAASSKQVGWSVSARHHFIERRSMRDREPKTLLPERGVAAG